MKTKINPQRRKMKYVRQVSRDVIDITVTSRDLFPKSDEEREEGMSDEVDLAHLADLEMPAGDMEKVAVTILVGRNVMELTGYIMPLELPATSPIKKGGLSKKGMKHLEKVQRRIKKRFKSDQAAEDKQLKETGLVG